MTTITIDLPKERAQKLREMALEFGVSMEDLARIGVEVLLSRPDEQFKKILEYVLKKNTDLYRRLAA